ncbi:monovalent cation/H+ antiporter complex subunit F [Microbacterium aurantiacum]|uniref:Pesticidal protein Cry26Aa n=1 Tax=Microbacterium aurantiacum TaxID=162393 RepID=A0ABT8FU27_9MICO|nr:monovalent cation/H+ antiporter complex subunit F [Microbacterium aurantiacum]MBN9200463.1 pesticidal protein Cry26Aa [Microbacterium chocolatum]MDN4464821.1 pesticidal protein Cry26Aa [Microbacterium aurantiacum]ODT11117.1 MAG: pesticidal protein Cry26Aa [Microbacterium sp. SCN 70-18]
MIGLDIAIGILALSMLVTTYRMLTGPDDADRVVAADLILFGAVGLIAVIGVRVAATYAFDIVLVATVVGFLAALSLARALTRGKR